MSKQQHTPQTVEIVSIAPTKIWVESDIMGNRIVVMQHEGFHSFDYATFGYDYAYTSNGGTHHAAESLARALGAKEPIEHRPRTFDMKQQWAVAAAAPDLLAALKELLADIQDYQRINHLGGESNHSQVLARAAIARAEGEA